MRRRRRHGLDLLPLLDVFMVVLFVFATIQERELERSTEASAALTRELAGLREQAAEIERLRAEQAAELAGLREQAREIERLREEREAAEEAAAIAETEWTRASEAEAELRAILEELRREAEQAAQTAKLPGEEALRRQDVLARLLDQFSVFEIEVDGELVGGAIVNHCCYRTEPLAGAWRSCGSVPAATTELADWLAEGGEGLLAALRRTRGGNALTIVRQNERATWRIARKLEGQLRERLPDHKIYGEGVALHALACRR